MIEWRELFHLQSVAGLSSTISLVGGKTDPSKHLFHFPLSFRRSSRSQSEEEELELEEAFVSGLCAPPSILSFLLLLLNAAKIIRLFGHN